MQRFVGTVLAVLFMIVAGFNFFFGDTNSATTISTSYQTEMASQSDGFITDIKALRD